MANSVMVCVVSVRGVIFQTRPWLEPQITLLPITGRPAVSSSAIAKMTSGTPEEFCKAFPISIVLDNVPYWPEPALTASGVTTRSRSLFTPPIILVSP